MIQFILATHGNFATGIKSSLDLIIGPINNLETLCCYTNEDFNLKNEVLNLLRTHSDKNIIIITDIFGGSVNNEFLNYIKTFKNLHVISGLNLPLILNLIENQNELRDIEEIIELSLKESNDSIKYCNREILRKIDLLDEEF